MELLLSFFHNNICNNINNWWSYSCTVCNAVSVSTSTSSSSSITSRRTQTISYQPVWSKIINIILYKGQIQPWNCWKHGLKNDDQKRQNNQLVDCGRFHRTRRRRRQSVKTNYTCVTEAAFLCLHRANHCPSSIYTIFLFSIPLKLEFSWE